MKKNNPFLKYKRLIKKEYSLCFDYLVQSKNFFYFILIAFFAFFLIGFFIQPSEIFLEKLLAFIEELLNETKDLPYFQLISFLFLNNLQVSFFGMVFGVFFGIFSLLLAFLNGYFLGVVSSIVVKEKGIGILFGLLPHGIFELPAVFISLGLGLKIGSFILQKNKIKSFRTYFWSSLRVFFLIVLPLLLIAAIIEGSLIFFFK